MGKKILKTGIFAYFDGAEYHQFGVTALEHPKSAAEVDMTDTLTPGNEKEYKAGRQERTFTVTIWKNTEQADPPVGVLIPDGLLDFEGYVYFGSFVFLEVGNSASIDEGVQMTFNARFTGRVVAEGGNNILQDAAGYDTGDWTDITGNWTVGAGVTATRITDDTRFGHAIAHFTIDDPAQDMKISQELANMPVAPDKNFLIVLETGFVFDQLVQVGFEPGGALLTLSPNLGRRIAFFHTDYDANFTHFSIIPSSNFAAGDAFEISKINIFQSF